MSITDKEASSIISVPITTSDEPTVMQYMYLTDYWIKSWRNSVNEKPYNLTEKGTWTPIGPFYKNGGTAHHFNVSTVLLTHIVLKIKRNGNGAPTCFKTCIVAGVKIM